MDSLLYFSFLSGAPGPAELILVFLVVLLLFGPRKLPAFARSLGGLMQQLRRASNDFRDQLMRVDEDVEESVRAVLEDVPLAAEKGDEPAATTDDPPRPADGEEEEGDPLAG